MFTSKRPSQKLNPRRRQPRFDWLETRALLTGSVSVLSSSTEVLIRGSSQTDSIAVTGTVVSGVEQLTITGLDTTVNGQASVTVPAAANLKIDLGDGGDTVLLYSVQVAGDASIRVGDSHRIGNDVIVDAQSSFGRDLSIRAGDVTGPGSLGNTVNADGSVGRDLTIKTGNALTDIDAGNFVGLAPSAKVGRDLTITTGDATTVEGAAGNSVLCSAFVGRDATIRTGNGSAVDGSGNWISLDSYFRANRDLTISTGDGDSQSAIPFLQVNGNAVLANCGFVGRDLTIRTGDGTSQVADGNHIEVSGNLNGGASRDIAITTGTGTTGDTSGFSCGNNIFVYGSGRNLSINDRSGSGQDLVNLQGFVMQGDTKVNLGAGDDLVYVAFCTIIGKARFNGGGGVNTFDNGGFNSFGELTLLNFV